MQCAVRCNTGLPHCQHRHLVSTHVVWCTEFHKVLGLVLASSIHHQVALVAVGQDPASRAAEHDSNRHDVGTNAQLVSGSTGNGVPVAGQAVHRRSEYYCQRALLAAKQLLQVQEGCRLNKNQHMLQQRAGPKQCHRCYCLVCHMHSTYMLVNRICALGSSQLYDSTTFAVWSYGIKRMLPMGLVATTTCKHKGAEFTVLH